MIINEGAGGGLRLDPLSNPGGASQALNGYQYYNQNGDVVTGNITTRSLSTPSISVSSRGLITASVSQNSGYVSSATKSATKQLTIQSGTTITPGTSQKTAVSSGRYTTGTVYVAGDSNLVASNIVSGVNIFGVTGTAQTLQATTIDIITEYDIGGRMYVYYYTGERIQSMAVHRKGTHTYTVVINGMILFWSDDYSEAYDATNFSNLSKGPGSTGVGGYFITFLVTGENPVIHLGY